MKLPKMLRIQQKFRRDVVENIPTATREELAALRLADTVKPGLRIGITVGSRGIRNLQPILRTCIRVLAELGAIPCLIAAMGSHGGGSEQGQREILDSLGITQGNLGAPVITCEQSDIVVHTAGGIPVFVLQSALTLEGILVVNRVKTHTSFKGPVESGLLKMLVVGLGGPKGAQQFHGFGPSELPRLLPELGEAILHALPVIGGLAVVENAYEETALIRAVSRDKLIQEEAALLSYSKSLMPSLPADDIDLLIVEEMGKNFSGTGMDTNIIGRARIHGVPEPDRPSIKRIGVLNLSEESHGNATGIGLADFVTQRVVDKMDRRATYLNCLTSTFVVRAAIPMTFDTERQLLDAALASLPAIAPGGLRIVVIPNTLFLRECLVSEALVRELCGKQGIELESNWEQFRFDEEENLLPRLRSSNSTDSPKPS